MDSADISQPLNKFLEWVKCLLPADKYAIFLQLFQWPTPNVQLTGTIFNELERVFDGKNPVLSYQFEDSTFKDDWVWYRQNVLNEPIVWRKKGWDAVKTAINSVIIVDLPTAEQQEKNKVLIDQSLNLPQPYFYFLGIENVVDYETTGDAIEWILFKQKQKGHFACFDDERFRTFRVDDKGEIQDMNEVPHDLGYCPARFFWSTELTQQTPDIKKSPISPQLGNLDWLLFFAISKKHLDTYGPYPIYSVYEKDCDYDENRKVNREGRLVTERFRCSGGFLKSEYSKEYVMLGGALERCPVCKEKTLAGAGSLIEVPIPNDNQPALIEAVKITTVDKSSLDYNVEEVKRLKSEVFAGVVGTGGDVEQRQSINEMQVTANFESRVNVLNSLKGNIEAAQKWTDDTLCKLRYANNFLGSSVSLGTEFYIYSVDDLYNQYEKAKKNGASSAILDSISQQITETEYRNNPQEMQRMLILKQLEPYRHYTLEEILQLSDKNLLNKLSLIIKINFPTFVDRFERENTNIIEFGAQVDFNKKIETIKQKLEEYGNEEIRQSEGSGSENPQPQPVNQ